MNREQRRQALDDMPRGHHARRAFALGLKTQAVVADGLTEAQKRRLDTELRPIVQRVQVLTTAAGMRGQLAATIDQAHVILDDIAGPGWAPRPDNPIDRQCRDELGYPVTDL